MCTGWVAQLVRPNLKEKKIISCQAVVINYQKKEVKYLLCLSAANQLAATLFGKNNIGVMMK